MLIEKMILAQFTMACHGGPGKLASVLLHRAFTEEDLMGHSLFGNNTKGQNEALDPVRVKAGKGFTYDKFPCTNVAYEKNNLASLLTWDLKSPEEPKLGSSSQNTSAVHLEILTFLHSFMFAVLVS